MEISEGWYKKSLKGRRQEVIVRISVGGLLGRTSVGGMEGRRHEYKLEEGRPEVVVRASVSGGHWMAMAGQISQRYPQKMFWNGRLFRVRYPITISSGD